MMTSTFAPIAEGRLRFQHVQTGPAGRVASK